MVQKSTLILTKVVNKMFSKRYLLYTNIGLSVFFSGLGDVIEQNLEILRQDLPNWDKKRTQNMAISGIAVGTLKHYCYKILDHLLPGYTIDVILKKIVIDQLVGSPLTITVFFGSIAILEGVTTEEFKHELKRKGWELYIVEWVFWPPMQFLNFYILSTKYRVLFDNVVSLLYDIFASRVKYLDSSKRNDKK